MSELVERLHTIRNHLRTGALGQREVWEDWLTEAAAEIERLRGIEFTGRKMLDMAQAEIERLQEEGTVELAKALLGIERLREALQAMMDGEPGCVLLARRALEFKP